MTKANDGLSSTKRFDSEGPRILGIDPGTRNLGYGVIEIGKGFQPQVVAHGVCQLNPSKSLPERLGMIFEELSRFMDQVQPSVVVVEGAFHGKNIQSALRIGEARGVVLACAATRGIPVEEYAPATIKKVLCGNGRAPKSQVQAMVERLLQLKSPIEKSDEADALAIAYCHAQKLRIGASLPQVKKSSRNKSGRRLSGKGLQDVLNRINRGAK